MGLTLHIRLQCSSRSSKSVATMRVPGGAFVGHDDLGTAFEALTLSFAHLFPYNCYGVG